VADTGDRHQWIWSEGGPLIAVPESAVHQWGGAAATYPADSPDYDRACSVDEEIGLITVGSSAVQALVISDPSNTTYLPDRRMFVAWSAADSESAILAGLDAALADAEWEDGPTWDLTEAAILFDSAYAGERIDPRNRLRIDVQPGRYAVRHAYVVIDDRTQVVVVHLELKGR
jgi:hypothetical protein